MPNTRSKASSEDGQEAAGGKGTTSIKEPMASMTAAEVEIIAQKFVEKEKRLREQAEALKTRQEELEALRRNTEQIQGTNVANLENRMEHLEQTINALTALPEQFNNLCQQLTNIQPESGRDTVNHFRNEPTNHSGQGGGGREPPSEIFSPIRLKDVIDSIPKYDGHKMSVFHFCKMCERALNLIPQYHEYHLVQLIVNKLQGHAYAAIEGSEYTTVFDLTRRLRKIFGPNKSTDQYRGELANIYMKPNENLLDYVERVKELRTAIMDGETTESGFIDASVKDSIEISSRESFVNGLPSDLLIRVKLQGYYSLEDAIVAAIQLSKTLEAENLRKRVASHKPTYTPPLRADVAYKPRQSSNFVNTPPEQSVTASRSTPFIKPLVPGQSGPNYTNGICFYCKNPGHLMKDCRKLAYRRAMEDKSRTPNSGNREISGNATSVPVTGVRRDAAQTGRPLTDVMILKEITEEPLPMSPN